MASIQERLKLKRAPTDIWSVREQLCLASSVLKSGDQNWMSVSRTLRPIADKDSTRPPDWFSQKSCAQQYAYLLENTDIPKRKKRESGETTSESIVRRLTQDRISELNKILAAQREEYQQLKNEVSLLKNGTVSDEKLQKMWFTIEQEEKEQEQKNKAHIAWLTKRQQNKESQSAQILSIQNVQKKINDNSTETQEITEVNNEEEDKRNKSGRSSLLTSLLKSPSPTTQIQTPTQAAGSPTIASLLCSSPKVPGPVIIQNVSPQLHQLVTGTISNTVQERPSASAPTLSMLLEQPSAGTQRNLQQQLQNASNLINSKNLQSPTQVQNTIQTRSSRLAQGNNAQITQVQQVISSAELTNTEIPQIISNPIDEVMPKVMQMDKDEINEIIGDIEELIKEEITASPQNVEPPTRAAEVINNLNVQAPTSIVTERSEPRNVDEPVSLSNSPTSEISIEEIDSSTSNIAEIIGTAIGTVESNVTISDTPKEAEDSQESKFAIEATEKEPTESVTAEEAKTAIDTAEETIKESKNEVDNKIEEIDISIDKELVTDELEESQSDEKEKEETSDDKGMDYEKIVEPEITESEIKIDDKEKVIEVEAVPTPEVVSISSDDTSNSPKQEEINEEKQDVNEISKDEKVPDVQIEENEEIEDITDATKLDDSKLSPELETDASKNEPENVDEVVKEIELEKEEKVLEQESNDIKNESKEDIKEEKKDVDEKIEEVKKEEVDITAKEEVIVKECEENDEKPSEKVDFVDFNTETTLKKENPEEILKNKESKENENIKISEVIDEIKIEPKKEDNEDNEEDIKQEKEELKKEIENDVVKKEPVESIGSVEELDEEEPTLSKLSGGRAMKTYSKKQNATVDSEPENETGGETADYRAWKKSIMLVYNRLATHKYASIFLRPITEDQAPGYHSIIFRPMDLLTIKKNIDNGTIRSTTHFQRDVMLMFQNAIMFNKHNTLVHKMTLEMQEECLQHMQVLVQAAGEASFRRETRTAASISNEAADSGLKRKWTHISSSPHESESPRMKKRRKSEND